MATINSSNIKDAGIVYCDGAGAFAGNNLSAVTNTIASTNANGDVIVAPNGTGGLVSTTSLTVGNATKDVSFTINGSAIAGTVSSEALDAATLGGIISHRHSATAGFGGHFIGLRSRGTHASPTIVSDDDTIGLMAFAAYDGTDYAQAAQIIVAVDGTPGSDDMPGRIVLLTSADGGQTPTEAMRIDSSQKVGIGTTTMLDTLNIDGGVDITHTAAANDEHALEIDITAAGFGDIKALDIVYVTGALAAGSEDAAILINVDETSSAGGEIVGYEMLSTSEGTDTVIGVKTGAGIDVVHQESGVFGDADNILNKAVDVTAALANGGAGNISVFVADNDTMTIGDAATFGEIEIILDTPSSGAGTGPTFQYSTGGAAYSAFVPVDGTNGFRNNGIIDWDATDLAGWATATSGEYEIIITRTRNTLSTTPILDEVQIAALTAHKWTKDGDINVASIALSDNTSYAVLCGGTSGTSAIQSIAGVGTSGQILTSNGAGALPTMQAPVAATDVSDATFRIQDNGDPTKEIAFEASVITTGTVRTITMDDAAVDLSPNDGTYAAAAGGTQIVTLGTITTGVWNGTDIAVADGGTGVSTLTDGGVLLGSGTGAITAMAVLSDGEMIVGDGTTDPVAESGATLRTSIGVGTGDTVEFAKLGLGTSTVPHATIGSGLLQLEGANASGLGPHFQITTASDDYPCFQLLNWRHDDIELMFDCFYNHATSQNWSGDAGSNFRFRKHDDALKMEYNAGTAAGSSITFATAFELSSNGELTLATQPWFFGVKTGGTNSTGDGTSYALVPTTIKDVGSNEASGTYTTPVTGSYLTSMMCYYEGIVAGHTYGRIQANTSNGNYGQYNTISDHASAFNGHSWCQNVDLDAADTQTWSYAVYGSTKVIDLNEAHISVTLIT